MAKNELEVTSLRLSGDHSTVTLAADDSGRWRMSITLHLGTPLNLGIPSATFPDRKSAEAAALDVHPKLEAASAKYLKAHKAVEDVTALITVLDEQNSVK